MVKNVKKPAKKKTSEKESESTLSRLFKTAAAAFSQAKKEEPKKKNVTRTKPKAGAKAKPHLKVQTSEGSSLDLKQDLVDELVDKGIRSDRYDRRNTDLKKYTRAMSGFCHLVFDPLNPGVHLLSQIAGFLFGIQQTADLDHCLSDGLNIARIHGVDRNVQLGQSVGRRLGVAILDGDAEIRIKRDDAFQI